MKEEILYVGIKEPAGIRRNLLEASKLVIQTLQKQESTKALREKKLKKTGELRKILREIKSLNSKLKESFPKIEPEEKEKTAAKGGKAKDSSELKELEKELEEVEKELDKLR